ncbi:MAG: M28 family peptidase [Saprospiraceae bacterium]
MHYFLGLLFILPIKIQSQASQDSASFFIREIYRQSYQEEVGYQWLTTLSKEIGHRLSGSKGAAKAVAWTRSVLDSMGLDNVWLQELQVPYWERGEKEQVLMTSKNCGSVTLKAVALGNSEGSGPEGVSGEVIEVQTLDELRAMSPEMVAGKIVFFNRPMDKSLPSMNSAYGGAVDQRAYGPPLAAQKGAVAAVVRSMSPRLDDHPHTGVTVFKTEDPKIPAVAISTNDAELLSKSIKANPTTIYVRTTCGMKGEATSYNVIGEIKGSMYPDEVILVGGHLDSWDIGDGAHDDGAGCMQSMEVMYRLKKNGYKPLRTIRCVLFMNEENGLVGALKYAELAIAKKEYHVAAIESDNGGHTPQAFGCAAGADGLLDQHLSHMSTYMNLLEPYYIQLQAGGGGADIGPLKPTAGILIGLRPDNGRYYDYHHSEIDILENVHPRELASGSAAMTSLVYLIDQYGIGK